MTKKKALFFFNMLLFTIPAFAQIVPKDQPATVSTVSQKDIEKLFSRGINEFALQQNFNFRSIKPENSDNKARTIGINLDYNRFIVDGFAIGAQVDFTSLRTEIGSINVVKGTSSMIYGNAIYGHSFENGLNLYGKASVGFGKAKTKSTGFPTSEDDLFGYKLEIGAPIHLFNDGGNYFTPYIRYSHLQSKDDGSKNSINQFSLGFQFQNYSACSAYQCDCKNGRSHSAKLYDQGTSYIGYTSFGNFGFGNSKYEFSGMTDKTDISGGSLNFEYGYYISKDIALGAGISWSGSTEDDGSGKSTDSEISFMPMITLNAPAKNCLENLFLQGGYGFGFEKTKFGSTEYKYNTTDLSIKLGYNHFFGKHIALTPKLGYFAETFKNTDSDVKNKQSGFEFGFGCSMYW